MEQVSNKLENRLFEEYPPCNLCNGKELTEVLRTPDGCRIVECDNCKLWFTSPRLIQKEWEFFLRNPVSVRNKRHVDNYFKHGVALAKNIGRQPSDWREKMADRHSRLFERISRWASNPIGRAHEVGCGVGFFLSDLRNKGIEVSGNDLNGYTVQVMHERLGLNVSDKNLADCGLESDSIDLVIMNDFIEHTYHPLEDLIDAHRVLKSGGLIFLQTFMIDSIPFDKRGGNWNMLWWNHVYHFSTKTLTKMLEKSGFAVKDIDANKRRGLIDIVAEK